MFLLFKIKGPKVTSPHPFTFQYVSIIWSATFTNVPMSTYLHSNMFLLFEEGGLGYKDVIDIYIPICFYYFVKVQETLYQYD